MDMEKIQQKKDDLKLLEEKLAHLEQSKTDDLGRMKSDMDKLQRQIEELKKKKDLKLNSEENRLIELKPLIDELQEKVDNPKSRKQVVIDRAELDKLKAERDELIAKIDKTPEPAEAVPNPKVVGGSVEVENLEKESEVKLEEEKDPMEDLKDVSIKLPDGTVESGWKILEIKDGKAFIVNPEKGNTEIILVEDLVDSEKSHEKELKIKTGDTVVFDGDDLKLENKEKVDDETQKIYKDDGSGNLVLLSEEEMDIENKKNESINKINEAQKKVDDLRIKFLEEYNKCKKESDKQNLISKTKNAILNIFKSKENKIHIKPEDFFTEDTIKAKKEYDQARINMGNVMYEEKKAELERAGLSGTDLEKALQEYKATEILAKTIIDERQKIIDAKINGKEINKSMWKKLIDGYISLKPRWKKVALSTILFTAAAGVGITTGGVFAGYGLASMAAMKFGTSMALGSFVGHAAKGVDLIAKKSDARFASDKNEDRDIWARRFSKGEIDQEKYEEEIEKIEKEEKKRARNRVLMKAGVGIALAGSAGFLAYDALGNGLSQADLENGAQIHSARINGENIDRSAGHLYPAGSGVTPNVDNVSANPMQNIVNNMNKPDVNSVYPAGSGVTPNIENNNVLFIKTEAVADHGQGAISTLRELQKNLRASYGDNLDRAPDSVKHILGTDPGKLAEEYGMYKPGQDAESVLIKSGSSFRVDESGNIVYHEVDGKDTILQKGVEVKASNVYEGKMVDTDNSGLKVEQPISAKVSNEDILNTTKSQDLNGKIVNENITGNVSGGEVNKGVVDDASNILRNELVGTYHRNIGILFPGNDIGMWDDIKNTSAIDFIVEHENKKDFYGPLLSYLGKLEEISGLKPRIETLTEPAESVSQFINRALKKIQEAGQLDKVTL